MLHLSLRNKLTKNNRAIFKNLSYISLLQCFALIIPLLTYPYLIKTLGGELYGWIILAQVVAGYASIVVGFGFNEVTARHIAIQRENTEKLSEIISVVMFTRLCLWVVSLLLYSSIIVLIPAYREYKWLFLLSFGCTFNELLFPIFYFQGIEKMGYITWITLVIRSISVIGIFLFVRTASDYLIVPALTALSYIIGGILALYIIFVQHRVRFHIPSYRTIRQYLGDSSTIFLTNVISTIKDKLNYILMGAFVPMSQIMIYDLGSKITGLLMKPVEIIATVLYPRISQTANIKLFKTGLYAALGYMVIAVLCCCIFLPEIVGFFIGKDVAIEPINVYLLAPVFLGASLFIAYNFLIAFNHVRYILKSIIVTTYVYLLLLAAAYFMGALQYVITFVIITVISYLAELIYRITVLRKTFKQSKSS